MAPITSIAVLLNPRELGVDFGVNFLDPHKAGGLFRIMPLTDAKIRSLKPKSKPYKVSDFDSLFLLITPKGSKLWKFKYRIGGKENRLAFGKYPYVTLQQARDRRDDARSLLEQGLDPAKKRDKDKKEVQAQSEHRFAIFAAQYIEKLVKEGKSEETLKKKNWLIGMANTDFGNTPINEITAQTILATLKNAKLKAIMKPLPGYVQRLAQFFALRWRPVLRKATRLLR